MKLDFKRKKRFIISIVVLLLSAGIFLAYKYSQSKPSDHVAEQAKIGGDTELNEVTEEVVPAIAPVSETRDDFNQIPKEAEDQIKNNRRAHIEKEKILLEDKTVAAIVNGEPIYQADIEIKLSANSTNRENYWIRLNAMKLSEEDYIKKMTQERKEEKGKERRYNQVTKNFNTETEKEKAFETALEEWMSQAEINII